MKWLYNFFIVCYSFAIRLVSPFNQKARQWVEGRENIFENINATISGDEKIIWFHCASLGEFEQGRPLIEAIKKTFGGYEILLTFFSPSGFEVRKNYPLADYVFYLPADTNANAHRFVDLVKPSLVFFVKYEFWFNYINVLSENKIPLFVVSAIFRPSQHFFKPWGIWSRKQLQKVTHFFVQNEESLLLLQSASIYHAEISGDTRFDRVIQLAQDKWENDEIRNFIQHKPCLVAGSTWPEDENILYGLLRNSEADFQLIIAPHVVSPEHCKEILHKFSQFKPVLFSEHLPQFNPDNRVLVVDTIGLLSYIYRYARISYIGGGLGNGIHNILEAATYGVPVIFGTNYYRFREAIELIKIGGAFSVRKSEELVTVFDHLMNNEVEYDESCTKALNYVKKNGGATSKIILKAKDFLFT